MNFTVILKPWLRTHKWNKILKDKAYICSSFDNLKNISNKVKLIERKLLVQEYIPGSEDHFYFCLAYYYAENNCLAAFTGQKLSQWPVLTGSTATTIGCVNETIKNDLLKIFSLLNFKGGGSIEYKKHSITGEYYITEPTVGQHYKQEFIATLN